MESAHRMSPFFSIIIPVYNVAPYLRECLDSVLAQTFTDWETICVDDGSTDGSGSILDEYAEKDHRFRVIHQSNAGVSVARNVGLNAIKGEYFLFIDGDDLIPTCTLGVYKRLINDLAPDVIFSNPIYLRFHDSETLNKAQVDVSTTVVANKYEVKVLRNAIDRIVSYDAPVGCVCGGCFSTKRFGDIRLPIGVRIMEDLRCCVEMACRGGCFVELSIPLYFYRARIGSAVYNHSFDSMKATFTAHFVVSEIIINSVVAPDSILAAYWAKYKSHYWMMWFGVVKEWHQYRRWQRQELLLTVEQTCRAFGARPPYFYHRLLKMMNFWWLDIPYAIIVTVPVRVMSKICFLMERRWKRVI